ncbi:hypothetical protein [Paenibacillus sp. 23TSA30-6]|uniref:hypothetical protein n=1 Tax=Paenibacillus sp. 23TSA30-6 TaxID=2546104 RepID=UPI00178820A8|nr:hypothetical protein [Paenibacillus sp. 23TSA30-6]MBE0336377.1 hypothetical protein [Paenibacillus sp. 23TSA30-6]
MKKIIISVFIVTFIVIGFTAPTMDYVYAEENSTRTTFDRIHYIQIIIHFKSLGKQLEAVLSERNNYPEDSPKYKELSEQMNHILEQETYYQKKLKALYSK